MLLRPEYVSNCLPFDIFIADAVVGIVGIVGIVGNVGIVGIVHCSLNVAISFTHYKASDRKDREFETCPGLYPDGLPTLVPRLRIHGSTLHLPPYVFIA
jgi:hypothetical protein